MSATSALRLAAIASLAALTSACALGERPTLAEQAPISDEAASVVMQQLQSVADDSFVATYVITPSSADEPTAATVTRTGDGVVTAQIGSVVYTSNPDGRTTTCVADGTNCDDFANDARISDLAVTHLFWGPSFERRLQTDSGRRIGTSGLSEATIAGQAATCVEVKVPSSLEAVGTVTYCAIEPGLLARYYGADVLIEMSSFQST